MQLSREKTKETSNESSFPSEIPKPFDLLAYENQLKSENEKEKSTYKQKRLLVKPVEIIQPKKVEIEKIEEIVQQPVVKIAIVEDMVKFDDIPSKNNENSRNNTIEKQNCQMCLLPISIYDNMVVMTCSHKMHAKCAVPIINANLNTCHDCDETGKYSTINWGNDYNIDNHSVQLAHMSKMISTLDVKGLNNNIKQNNFPTKNDITSKFAINLSILEQTQLSQNQELEDYIRNGGNSRTHSSSANSKMSMSFIGKRLFGIQLNENNIDLQSETNPITFIKNNISSIDMYKKYHIDIRSFIKYQVNVEILFENGYDISDLLILMTTWNDLISMGFNHLVWKKHKDKISIPLMITVYRITIADVFETVCKSNIDNLIYLELSSSMYSDLKANVFILYTYKLTKNNMFKFKFSPKQWHDDLKLTGVALYHLLLFRPCDLHDNRIESNLKWVNWENVNGPTYIEFTHLFPDYPKNVISDYIKNKQ
jgi:hypothetical protein